MKLKAKYKPILIAGAILLIVMNKNNISALFSAVKNTLASFLPPWELFRAYPYWDVKQWSWGYGTRVPNSVNDPNVKPSGTITREKAMEDLIKHANTDYNYLEGLVKVPLNQNQWAAYLSFSYNLGPGNADNLITNINAKNWAALEVQWKKYIYADGAVSQNLIDRRAAEWRLFVS